MNLFAGAVLDSPLTRSLTAPADRVRQFAEHGFFVVDGVLSQRVCEEAKERIRAIVDQTSPGADKIGITFEPGKDPSTLTVAERHLAVRKLTCFVENDAFFRKLAATPSLLDPLNDVRAGTIRLFQDMMLIKPSGGGREKPWHQDLSYFSVRPPEAVIGCWIAFDEATVDNGCMHVTPGSHRQGLVKHWQPGSGPFGWEWQLSAGQVETKQILAVPLPPGSCLFFSSILKHGTPPNNSDRRRQAIQLHYAIGNYEWIGAPDEKPKYRLIRRAQSARR